jgi:DNA-binding PadR family transcriptional regulator
MPQFRAASNQTRNLLAEMLAQRTRWLHGYDLSERCGLKSGTLYPILMRLSDRGLLESKWEPSEHPGRPPRKLYRLTPQGVSYAREHLGGSASARRRLLPGRA